MVADFFLAALTCLLLSMALRIIMWLVFGMQQPHKLCLFLVILSRALFLASLAFIFIALFSASGISWILIPFLIECVLLYFITGRRVRRDSLLNLLAISTERGLPLSELVQVWNKSHFGSTGKEEAFLVALLAQGTPATVALAVAPDALPGTTSVFARAGALSGSLGPAFRAAVQQEAQSFALRKRLRDLSAYLVILPPVLLFILTFFMIKLIPAFQKIFNDFGLSLPPITRIIISVSEGAAMFVSLMILPLSLVSCYLMWVVIGTGLRSRWTYRFQPGLRSINNAAVLKLLSVVVRQKQPMQPALALLAKDHPHKPMRHQLQQALEEMEAGNDWCESLLSVKIIGGTDAALLHAAQRLGNLPWALEQAAESITRRAVLRQEAITRILVPLLILLIGISVGFMVIALFVPLVKLVESLT